MNDAYEKRVQNQFGGFCTKVLKNEARHIQREYARHREREMSIDDLTPAELEQTAHEDHYFNGEHSFEVDGFPVVWSAIPLQKRFLSSLLSIRK